MPVKLSQLLYSFAENTPSSCFVPVAQYIIEEGSFADLIIVEGNPVEDLDIIANKDNMKLIMKDGEIYKNMLLM
ncbi:hypothetical protein [Peptoclostridium litorale]|nr:hypothetical protein [Peptoclostridium litorale]